MKTILVTGSAGFIGSALVKELRSQKYTVHAFDYAAQSKPKDKNIIIFQGDIRNYQDVSAAVKGCDAVLHIAGALGSTDYQLNYDIHVRGTKHVVRACKEHNVKRLIGYSSIAATRDNPGYYGETKKKSESILNNSGLDVTIFRPTMVVGKRSKGLKSVVKQIKSYPVFIPILGTGKATRQPIWVSDLAKLTVSALAVKKSFGKTYYAAGEETISFKKLVDTIREELGVKKKLIPIPTFIAQLIAQVLEMGLKNPPFTYENVRNLGMDEEVSIENTKKDFSFTPTPLSKVITTVTKDFK